MSTKMLAFPQCKISLYFLYLGYLALDIRKSGKVEPLEYPGHTFFLKPGSLSKLPCRAIKEFVSGLKKLRK
jgi:hypothetical protein